MGKKNCQLLVAARVPNKEGRKEGRKGVVHSKRKGLVGWLLLGVCVAGWGCCLCSKERERERESGMFLGWGIIP